MNDDSKVNAIIDRQREIDAQIEDLQRERSELEVALTVLRRFGALPEVPVTVEGSRLGPPRPEGTPSLFEMTEAVLKDAIKAGKAGLKGREIVDEIGKRYWPGVKSQQILPPIYQFASKGRLKKGDNGIFRPV